MEVVGSEIGQKMRSAIKAKLTELGCYVDDELPDYVMVMVANKRTRAQMDDDLQLFLGDNTELFVNWLHQVLKKLQEVTVAPIKPTEPEKSKDRSHSKDKKSKEKKSKDKQKKSDLKKAKKKDKEKLLRKKDDRKIHKAKKKSKHEMIRPNIPPLLMNMEKDSEPSITDVFAGQILKNHGITLDTPKDDSSKDKKPVLQEIKRAMLPIIDPATIPSQATVLAESQETEASTTDADQIKEITEIEAKIQGLKQKLAEQLDSMSDDEDFLNIRTEAEELMNDFAEDVFQEISEQIPAIATPPIEVTKPLSPVPVTPKETPKEIETLPQIELNLPKRPIRERLGARDDNKKVAEVQKEVNIRIESPERFTPERELVVKPSKFAKSRLGDVQETKKSSESDKPEIDSSRKITSKVSVLGVRPSRSTCASVVRVRPRPRVSAPSLLLRAVADAHKSLLNAPAKLDQEPQHIKRALVLPMRRCVDAQKIVIQVPADTQDTGDSISLGDSDDDKSSRVASDIDHNEYIPTSITKKITNNEYTPSKRNDARTTTLKDDKLVIETINIHNPSVNKDKSTQFIVTMDGYHPNAFLAKKLLTEGLINDEKEINDTQEKPSSTTETKEHSEKTPENVKEKIPEKVKEKLPDKVEEKTPEKNIKQIKRLSNTSDDSDTQVIIKKDEVDGKLLEVKEEPPVKKRKASPIVFDVSKKGKEDRVRERTESAGSDSHVVVTTAATHKYDAVPPLSATERKSVWCRAFPLCRYGSSCAFSHPRCKFAASCTRRNCVYAHAPGPLATTPSPSVASHVVPAANYKSISTVVPNMCKFYPSCVNPTCHYYHPKPCRYGNNCANKLECNFYHAELPNKWRYTV